MGLPRVMLKSYSFCGLVARGSMRRAWNWVGPVFCQSFFRHNFLHGVLTMMKSWKLFAVLLSTGLSILSVATQVSAK